MLRSGSPTRSRSRRLPGRASPVLGEVRRRARGNSSGTRALDLGPAWLAGQQAGEITALATRGLDELDSYFARYVPQLVLAVVVPAAVLARVAAADWVSAVIIAVTLRLIPVFAVLVCWHTRARTRRQWLPLATLAGHFLDVVEGLPTLKVPGRAKAQAEVIAAVTGAHRALTMPALRVAFCPRCCSSCPPRSPPPVAAEVGLRLLSGRLGHETALLTALAAFEAVTALPAAALQLGVARASATRVAWTCARGAGAVPARRAARAGRPRP